MELSDFLLEQLPYLAPRMLVELVGVVLAFVFIKRYPTPAALTLAGCGLLLALSAVFPILQWELFESRRKDPMPDAQFRRSLMILSVGATILRTIGFGLVVTAIFVGRKGDSAPISALEISDDTPRDAHRGTIILVMGILSLVSCAPLGFAAWFMGTRDLKAMREGRMDPSGRSSTAVGHVLGVIGSIIFVLSIASFFAWYAIFAAAVPAR